MEVSTRAVLFDLDGVLVETEYLKAEAHAGTVRQLGGQADESLYRRVMGQSFAVVQAAFIRAGGVEISPQVYTGVYLAHYEQLLDTRLRVAPGVPELLAGLQESGFALALVTSSLGRSVEKVLALSGLGRFFTVRVVAEDVRLGKPAPEPYLTARQRLGGRAEQAAAVEDSQAGIEAAVSAGLPVLAVRHAYNAEHDFSKARAVVDTLDGSAGIIALLEKLLVDGPGVV